MNIFTPEARVEIARRVGWRTDKNGFFSDHAGRPLTDLEAWPILIKVVADTDVGSVIAYGTFCSSKGALPEVRPATWQPIVSYIADTLM